MKKNYDIASGVVALFVAVVFVSPIWDLVMLFSVIVEDELFKLLLNRRMANFLDLVLTFGLGLLVLYVSLKILQRISNIGLIAQDPWAYAAKVCMHYVVAVLLLMFAGALFTPVLYFLLG